MDHARLSQHLGSYLLFAPGEDSVMDGMCSVMDGMCVAASNR
jgi:hypothetical protein